MGRTALSVEIKVKLLQAAGDGRIDGRGGAKDVVGQARTHIGLHQRHMLTGRCIKEHRDAMAAQPQLQKHHPLAELLAEQDHRAPQSLP